MLRYVLGDVNAVAGARAVVAVVNGEAKHGDHHDRAAEYEGKDGIAAAVTGTVGHFLMLPEGVAQKNEPRGATVLRVTFSNVKAEGSRGGAEKEGSL
jgi:hypothetical protein